MYIKTIYDEWNLHHDATQLEINYNFLIKFIDILDVESLSQTLNDNPTVISDSNIIREWKMWQMSNLLHQFKQISNYDLPFAKWINHPKLFIRAVFIAGNILNDLKETNYKASEILPYYEPKLFVYAQKYLDLDMLEEWMDMLSSRIFEFDDRQLDHSQRLCTWALLTDRQHLKNVVWFVENLLLNFKDITIWFNQISTNPQLSKTQHAIIINIINHAIIYALTDFYTKYYMEVLSDKYAVVYQNVLNEIALDVNNRTFALVSFKQISLFLNYLLKQEIVISSDAMINNYLNFIKICCSDKNILFLKQLLFNDNNSVKTQGINLNAVNTTHNKKILTDVKHDQIVRAEIPVVSYKTVNEINNTNSQLSTGHHATSVLSSFTSPLQSLKNKFNKPKIDVLHERSKNSHNTIDDKQLEIDFSQKEVDEYE